MHTHDNCSCWQEYHHDATAGVTLSIASVDPADTSSAFHAYLDTFGDHVRLGQLLLATRAWIDTTARLLNIAKIDPETDMFHTLEFEWEDGPVDDDHQWAGRLINARLNFDTNQYYGLVDSIAHNDALHDDDKQRKLHFGIQAVLRLCAYAIYTHIHEPHKIICNTQRRPHVSDGLVQLEHYANKDNA